MSHLLAQLVSFTNLLSNLYIADFFDVLIIALLIYFIIFLFKQTRSFYVAAGVLIIVALYAVAKTFGLYLTSLIFQAIWGVFFIALVVIFQEELRRFFEYLAIWSTRQVKQGGGIVQGVAIKEILNAIKQMARDKIGALIVIQGRDSLTKFVSGGKMLDGIISEELLLSIFDPGSSGHDGALIVKSDRVALFGGHLPLSHDFAQIGKRGTRHSAALGIAEVSDAFVIVVSEERGEISYAYDGKLTSFKYAEEVSAPLKHFLSNKFPTQASTPLQDLIKHNSLEKLLALFVATIFWFFFSFQAATIQRDFTVPITYKNIGNSILIEETMPKEITVTLAARGATAFDLLDTKSLTAEIDASELKTGAQKIVITGEAVKRPSNFSVVNVRPSEVTAKVRPVKLIEMTIVPNVRGIVATGFEIAKITVNPPSVMALVPESFNETGTITTEPINITGSRLTYTTTTKIIIAKNISLKDRPDTTVEVKIEIRRK